MSDSKNRCGPRILCLGQAVQDFVFGLDQIPRSAEKYQARAFDMVGGGPAASAAVAIGRLGGAARLAARVGDDPVGRIIVDELTACGVDCGPVSVAKGCRSSASAVITSTDGERMIVNFLDPNLPAALPAAALAAAQTADAVLTDTRWPAAAGELLSAARGLGIPAILDADIPVPADPDFLRAATHVAFSADGLRQLTGDEDLPRSLREAARRTNAWCCVTDGAAGVLVHADGELLQVPGFEVRVIDTLGAGDVWHGAFAFELGRGRHELEAVRFANAAAALKVSAGGGRSGAPGLADVEALLAQPDSRSGVTP